MVFLLSQNIRAVCQLRTTNEDGILTNDTLHDVLLLYGMTAKLTIDVSISRHKRSYIRLHLTDYFKMQKK